MRRPPRPLLLVSLATAFSLLGDQALYVLLPTQHSALGLLPYQFAILLAVNRWVRLGTNYLAAWLLPRLPRAVLLASALAVGAALTAIYATVIDFGVLLAARATWGLCWSVIRQTGLATTDDSSAREHLGEAVGHYNGLSRIGSMAGNLLGGLGHDLLGFRGVLLGLCGLSVIGVPLGIASQRSAPRHSTTDASDRGPTAPAPLLMACGLIVGCVGPGMLMATLGYMLRLRLGDGWTIGDRTIHVATISGVVLATRWAVDLLCAPMLGRASDVVGRARAGVVSYSIGAVALLVGSVTVSTGAFVASVVAFFVCGSALTVILSAEAVHRGPGSTAGFVTAMDVGAAVGPLIGGLMIQFGMNGESVLLAGVAFYTLGSIVVMRALRPRS